MPKELVFAPDRPYTDASSAQSVVGVHWGGEMDGYLQVSTMLFNDDGKYVTLDESGNSVTRTAEGDEAVRRDIWARGFYVSLGRKEVNHLIRNLRRARDQAFGRDE